MVRVLKLKKSLEKSNGFSFFFAIIEWENLMKTYRTKDLADLLDVHVNTIRLYEAKGYIEKVPRGHNNYRLYNDNHLRQLRFCRILMPGPYPIKGKRIIDMIKLYQNNEKKELLHCLKEYEREIKSEMKLSKEALKLLDDYKESALDRTVIATGRKEMSKLMSISIDTLRTWERYELYKVAKDNSGKIIYEKWQYDLISVIRLLRKSGISLPSLHDYFNYNHLEKPSDFLLGLYKNNETVCKTTDWLAHLNDHYDRCCRAFKYIDETL